MDAVERLLLEGIPTAPGMTTTTELRRLLARGGHDLGARAVQKRLASMVETYDLQCNTATKPTTFWFRPGAKRRHLDQLGPDQALALALAHEHLRDLFPPSTLRWMTDRLDDAKRSLEVDPSGRANGWRRKVRRVPHELPRKPPQVSRAVAAAVSEGLYDGLALEVRYQKRFSDAPEDYTLHPLGLLERSGELWLVARKVSDDGTPGDVHFFLLHRMRSARVLRGVRVAVPQGFSLQGEIERGLPHFLLDLGSRMKLVVRFDDSVVARLEESPLSEDQQIVKIPGGGHRLKATVAHTRALESFLLGYGPLAVVESPPRLRAILAERLEAAARAYR